MRGIGENMAKWVTFYYGITDGGVRDLVEHNDKASAEEYFIKNYRKYFTLNGDLKKIKLPMSYGYPHRKFYVMTKYKYEKYFC